MATASVPQNVHEIDTAGELDWEEQIYGECCAWARQQAEAYFTDLEERLHQERPAGWEVEGKRRRRMVTRFGEVTIVRRLYRDAAGAWLFFIG